ncbi:MAG: hypothetical protein HYS44_03745 [Candidatus Niyogibacteria bacterium]|nr:hypothetical protein [Candidatus Niyogibacteria bacterium]
MPSALRWTLALGFSVLCISILNFLHLQGILGFMQIRPVVPSAADFFAQYLDALFISFDGIVFGFLLLHFHSMKKNLADLFAMCGILTTGLFIIVFLITAKTPAIGLWLPLLFNIQLFPFA